MTTSIWLPGASNANQSFVGSVITKSGDRTTLSVAFDGDASMTEDYGIAPGYVTVGGTTYMAYQVTTSDSDSDPPVTVDLACSRADGKAVPTCTYTMPDLATETASPCSSQTGVAVTMTDTPEYSSGDFSPIVRTVTETRANACIGSVNPSDFSQTTTTLTGDEQYYLNNYKLVITAGTEKLNASAAMTPTGSGVPSTGALVSSGTTKGPGAPQNTGAATPTLAMAPVLAGLGAAAAFFV